MSRIHGPRPTGVDQRVFEKNALHTGQASEGVSKKEKNRLAASSDSAVRERAADSVQLSSPHEETADLHKAPLESEVEQAADTPLPAQPESLMGDQAFKLYDGLPDHAALLADPATPQPGTPPAAPATDPSAPSAPQPGTGPATPPPATEPGAPPNAGAPPAQPPPGGAPAPGEPAPAPAPPPTSPATEAAQRAKMMQDEMQTVQSIYLQMAADRQKWMMEMWKILQDTQTSIFNIVESVILNREKTMTALADKWAACLGGY